MVSPSATLAASVPTQPTTAGPLVAGPPATTRALRPRPTSPRVRRPTATLATPAFARRDTGQGPIRRTVPTGPRPLPDAAPSMARPCFPRVTARRWIPRTVHLALGSVTPGRDAHSERRPGAQERSEPCLSPVRNVVACYPIEPPC